MTKPEPPLLLTPGPLTTAAATRDAMLRDWGSRDRDFIELGARVRKAILDIAEGDPTHECVPLQGSGTFAVEATVGTMVPPGGKLLVLSNGAYGHRIAEICHAAGIEHVEHSWQETDPVAPEVVARILADDDTLSHVAVVHCETTTGILNPVEDVADVVAGAGRSLLVDAMSTFGAIPLSATRVRLDALIASSNKCLEGVPGLGFTVIRRDALAQCEGNSRSLSLDLFEQWRGLEANGQWRFTPPTQVVAALDQALAAHRAEGGSSGRLARYRDNCRALVDGMRSLGFETLLPDDLQAPIIVTFRSPSDPNFRFATFHERIAARGFVIYPGKLTAIDTFRIGCIGHLRPADLAAAVGAIGETLEEMGVARRAP